MRRPEVILIRRTRAAISRPLSLRPPCAHLPFRYQNHPHVELFNSLGVKVSKEKVKEMFAEVDEDGSGEIDFDEFLILVAKQVVTHALLTCVDRAVDDLHDLVDGAAF